MQRTQIQFPDPLYQRVKEIAQMYDWALADVVRRAVELYVVRFPEMRQQNEPWAFPIIDAGGDFLVDPAAVKSEVEAVRQRSQ
jgi:hypothetical protein